MRDFMEHRRFDPGNADFSVFQGDEQAFDAAAVIPSEERAELLDAVDAFLESTAFGGLAVFVSKDPTALLESFPEIKPISEIINPT